MDFGALDFNISGDMSGAGVLAPTPDAGSSYSFGVLASDAAIPNTIPFLNTPLFAPATMAPDGVQLINTRSNTSFWNFDQSQIPTSIQNVIGSVVSAATKSAVQNSADLINKQSAQPGYLGQFAKNFQSTQTGAQLNAGAIATQFQNFIANPIVWFAAAAAIVLLVFARK